MEDVLEAKWSCELNRNESDPRSNESKPVYKELHLSLSTIYTVGCVKNGYKLKLSNVK